MNKAQLEVEVLESIRSYWRIKAALAVYQKYAQGPEMKTNRVYYTGIPQKGTVANFISEETLDQALSQISVYSSNKLAKETFLTLISHLEELLSSFLLSIGHIPKGTFGQLQTNVQKVHTIPQDVIDEIDEIRERRNCLIHHAGMVEPRYISVASKIFARSNGWIADPSTISTLDISSGYLSYAGDVIIRYARCLP